MNRFLKEESGVLTFEWILLITVLVIGIVGGLSAVRDAMIDELGDVAEAMLALDQSYYILWPWECNVGENTGDKWDGAAASKYHDAAKNITYSRPTGDSSGTSPGTGYDTGVKLHQPINAIPGSGTISLNP